MSSWRERLSTLFGPGILPGISFGDWFKLLRDNRFRIHPYYLPRAASISCGAIINSSVRWYEDWRHAKEVEATEIRPPLFVLGHWRSGTTLLHDLLTLDNRFGFPNLYQAMRPHTFLSTERFGARLLRLLTTKQRPQDNMRIDPASAWEDEFVMCACGFRTPYLTWVFPCRANHYDQFLTFGDLPPKEMEQWRATLQWFLKKLTLKYDKPLILKSPTHTSRIKILLETFPHAKFVHIHRNPFAVFRSSIHMYSKVLPTCRLQRTDQLDWVQRVLRQYEEMYDAFFAQRDLIPVRHFHEVCFEDLEKDPLGQMKLLYESLELPDFGSVEPGLCRYMESLASYRKNVFSELKPEIRQRVASQWQRSFDEWGYQK
jgi:hypothetical protein